MCCMYRRCSKELNQWEMLTEYGNAKGNTNSHLVLESAWRQQNYWAIVKDAVSQVTSNNDNVAAAAAAAIDDAAFGFCLTS